jgi:hypothetical protein
MPTAREIIDELARQLEKASKTVGEHSAVELTDEERDTIADCLNEAEEAAELLLGPNPPSLILGSNPPPDTYTWTTPADMPAYADRFDTWGQEASSNYPSDQVAVRNRCQRIDDHVQKYRTAAGIT